MIVIADMAVVGGFCSEADIVLLDPHAAHQALQRARAYRQEREAWVDHVTAQDAAADEAWAAQIERDALDGDPRMGDLMLGVPGRILASAPLWSTPRR